MSYVIVVNIPGYLPEADPIEADDLGEARTLLAEALEETAGARDLDGTLEELEARRDAFEADPGEVIHLGGYAHSLLNKED